MEKKKNIQDLCLALLIIISFLVILTRNDGIAFASAERNSQEQQETVPAEDTQENQTDTTTDADTQDASDLDTEGLKNTDVQRNIFADSESTQSTDANGEGSAQTGSVQTGMPHVNSVRGEEPVEDAAQETVASETVTGADIEEYLAFPQAVSSLATDATAKSAEASGNVFSDGENAWETNASEGENGSLALSMTANAEAVKAGSSITYDICLTNQTEVPIYTIRLQSVFSYEGIQGSWQSTQGMTCADAGGNAELSILDAKETRHIFLTLQIPEDANTPLEHTVYASVQSTDGNTDRTDTSVCVTVVPLTVDFIVEKCADRTSAYPGDTITYQICIRNTGERTLHSIVSTERFENGRIQAVFQPQEGVKLNGSATQAYIAALRAGEEIVLTAKATLPELVEESELVNQVYVITEETGSTNMISSAVVQIQTPVTATPAPSPAAATEAPVSTKAVMTGDMTDIGRWGRALAASAVLIILLYVHKRVHKKPQKWGDS